MILRVGLTGGIASGKSTVAKILARLGCTVFDADEIVRDLYRPGQKGHETILRHYGAQILRPDGEIDRVKLSAVALATPDQAAVLNGLIHPFVAERVEQLFAEAGRRHAESNHIVVIEATLLLEAGTRDRYDRVVVVDADPEEQVSRAVERGLDRDEVHRRVSRQIDRKTRLAAADYVISTTGGLAETETRTRETFLLLERDARKMARTIVDS